MNQAMNPEKPNKVSDVATQLEQWSALVESLEKYGPANSLPLPSRVTALRITLSHAGDWCDDWQQDCYKIPEVLNIDTCQSLLLKCEDWARK